MISSPTETQVAHRQYQLGSLTYSRSRLISLFSWLLLGDFCANLMETVIPNVIPLRLKSLGCLATLISIVLTRGVLRGRPLETLKKSL